MEGRGGRGEERDGGDGGEERGERVGERIRVGVGGSAKPEGGCFGAGVGGVHSQTIPTKSRPQNETQICGFPCRSPTPVALQKSQKNRTRLFWVWRRLLPSRSPLSVREERRPGRKGAGAAGIK